LKLDLTAHGIMESLSEFDFVQYSCNAVQVYTEEGEGHCNEGDNLRFAEGQRTSGYLHVGKRIKRIRLFTAVSEKDDFSCVSYTESPAIVQGYQQFPAFVLEREKSHLRSFVIYVVTHI
jgi:hypothetical protein